MDEIVFKSIEINAIVLRPNESGNTILYFVCSNRHKASDVRQIFASNPFRIILYSNLEKELCLRVDFGDGFFYNIIGINRDLWYDCEYINFAYRNDTDVEFLHPHFQIRHNPPDSV